MIGAILLASVFQLAAAPQQSPQPQPQPSSLVMRDANRSVRVPLVSSANGPMLRPESLAPMLPVTVHHDSAAAYTVEVLGVRIELQAGVAVARIGSDIRQLASPPVLQSGHLMVPLQLVSDVFPGVVPNARWDAESGQLVVFNPEAARSAGLQAGLPPNNDSPRQRAGASREASLPPVPVKHNRRTVIVDAGHGGVDNGMTGPLGGGPKIYEKNITLAIALKLGEQLKERGVDVVYTRTTDTLIALDDRGRIANRSSGDLFISIHVNAANPNWKDPGGSRGFETYFLSEAKTEDARRVEHMENESAQYEDGSRTSTDDPLSFIFNDMAQNQHLRESSDLAETIQHTLRIIHPGPNRGVKQAGFRVLVTAYMPAVLVEVGFGTNPREAAYLSNPEKQDALASAIADGAMEYLQKYERRVTGAGAGGGAPAP